MKRRRRRRRRRKVIIDLSYSEIVFLHWMSLVFYYCKMKGERD
jgi:hypothetical protein